jgi:frataxin
LAAQDEADYHRRAEAVLLRIAAAAEDSLADHAEVEHAGSVLTVEIDDESYVINKHEPTRQIWLSSPVSGAWHFVWQPDRHGWIDTRHGQDLLALLAAEWSAVSGVDVSFG